MVPTQQIHMSSSAPSSRTDVVEIGLLLPSGQMNGLIELAAKRQQSVAQLLRNLIHRELEVVEDDHNRLVNFSISGTSV